MNTHTVPIVHPAQPPNQWTNQVPLQGGSMNPHQSRTVSGSYNMNQNHSTELHSASDNSAGIFSSSITMNSPPRGMSLSSTKFSPRSPKSVLDDPNFAPAPAIPRGMVLPKDKFEKEFQMRHSTLPEIELVKHSGRILGRLSMRSLVTKRWRVYFWVTYGDHQVLFFRSREDYNEWVSNPMYSREQRDYLVKLKINFLEEVNQRSFVGHKATNLKFKQYSSKMLHTFKLEKLQLYGPSIVAAFAANHLKNATALHQILREMIQKNPAPNKVVGRDGNTYDISDLYSDANSTRSGYSQYSEHSRLSGRSAPVHRSSNPEWDVSSVTSRRSTGQIMLTNNYSDGNDHIVV